MIPLTKRRAGSPLDRHRLPTPPPELEARVLAAAAIATRRAIDRRGWVDRLWESRSTRLLWGASAGVLLLANLISTGPVGLPANPPSPPAGTALVAALDPLATGSNDAGTIAAERSGAFGFIGYGYQVGGAARRNDGVGVGEWRRQVVALLELESSRESPRETTGADRRRREPRR